MKIKYSKRGLSFIFNETDTFHVGTRYRYVINKEKAEVYLLPDENGRYKLSRRFSKDHERVKPLVDLRNAEIKEAMADARYMEVEVRDDKIVIRMIRSSVQIDTLSEIELTELIDRSDSVTFEIDKESLLREHEPLYDMLNAAGLFSAKEREDISYVFDTISLFSGAGLLDYPFKKDGSFSINFAVDFNEAACETYRHNIGDHILCMDMQELDTVDIPETDLIIGGPCCQGYSNENRQGHKEQDEKKRMLVKEYIRVVQDKKPLMFVFENVPEFLTKEKGKYLEKVLSDLSDEYNMTYSVVNDHDLGGYTTRRRVLLIGAVKAMDKVIIPDIELTNKKTCWDALKKVTPDWFHYKDISKSKAETKKRMSFVRNGHNWQDIPPEFRTKCKHSDMYYRLDKTKPSITIPNWGRILLMPPCESWPPTDAENRILSVAEAAALMGLDKDYRFYGGIAEAQQQIGNGVTQAIATFLKDIVKNALFGFANRNTFRLLPT